MNRNKEIDDLIGSMIGVIDGLSFYATRVRVKANLLLDYKQKNIDKEMIIDFNEDLHAMAFDHRYVQKKLDAFLNKQENI